MFTGLIEEVGTVARIDSMSRGSRLSIAATLVTRNLKEGDSVAVDGVCLTAVACREGEFAVDVSPETIARSNLVFYQGGTRVNLERPLPAAGRVGGHFVQGHVDATTQETHRREEGEFVRLAFAMPPGLEPYIVEKGSIAVNGVSLTVASLQEDCFEVQLVPHTVQRTNLGSRERAAALNVEVDILGKYVARLLQEKLGVDLDGPGVRSGDVELVGRHQFVEPVGESR